MSIIYSLSSFLYYLYKKINKKLKDKQSIPDRIQHQIE